MINNYRFFYIILTGLITINLAFSYGYKPKPEEKKKASQKISVEDGGPGFEKIAKSLGWETNDNPKYIGDSKSKKGGMLTIIKKLLSFLEFTQVFTFFIISSVGIISLLSRWPHLFSSI